MNKETIKEKAIILRKKGKTYSEINKELGLKIAKSTLSYWCRGIILPPEYSSKINLLNLASCERGRAVALVVNKQRREKFLQVVRERNTYLLNRVDKHILKMLLAMIYICEGSRWSVHRGLSFGNTDPEMIKFYIYLLKSCYPEIISHENLHCRIGCRADQNIKELEKFWSKTTGIPLSHFCKTSPDPRTVGKKTKKPDYKGVCSITSRGTEIQLELEMIAKMFFRELIKEGP
ncbi:MAG: hypothetical protein NTV62_01540 [Candidatus Gribaldobacteria bacterium]|nr:hypothetical protein [Candidatus Gribaldobacteria bacterium]